MFARLDTRWRRICFIIWLPLFFIVIALFALGFLNFYWYLSEFESWDRVCRNPVVPGWESYRSCMKEVNQYRITFQSAFSEGAKALFWLLLFASVFMTKFWTSRFSKLWGWINMR